MAENSNGGLPALVNDYRNLLWVAVYMMIAGSYGFTAGVLLYLNSQSRDVDHRARQVERMQYEQAGSLKAISDWINKTDNWMHAINKQFEQRR